MRSSLMLILALVPGVLRAQSGDLDREAERARRAWYAHDAGALVANSPRLVVRNPLGKNMASPGRSRTSVSSSVSNCGPGVRVREI